MFKAFLIRQSFHKLRLRTIRAAVFDRKPGPLRTDLLRGSETRAVFRKAVGAGGNEKFHDGEMPSRGCSCERGALVVAADDFKRGMM